MKINIYTFWIVLLFCLFLTACSNSDSSLNEENNQESYPPATDVELPSTYEPIEEQILEYPLNGYTVWPANTPDYSEGLSWVYYDNEYGERIYAAIDNTGLAAFTLPENYGEHIVQSPQNFENGVAIILTKSAYNNNESFMLIDRNGNLLRASDEACPTTITRFVDDSAIVCVDADLDGSYNSDYDSFYTIDLSGNILYSHTSTMEERIFPIGYANGHFVLMRRIVNFSTNERAIGTMDRNGNMLHEFSVASGIYEDFTPPSIWSTLIYDSFAVVGNYLFDTDSAKLREHPDLEGTFISFDNNSHAIYENGYAYYHVSSTLYKVTADMLDGLAYWGKPKGATVMDFEPLQNYFSDGLILGDKGLHYGEDGHIHREYGYFDKDGNLVFNVSTDNNATYGSFYNGYASVLLLGADQNWYVTIIDKTGTRQYDPIKVTEKFVGGSSIVIYQSAGYMKVLIGERSGSLIDLSESIWPFGESVYINPNGKLVTVGVDDFSVFSDGDYPEIDVYNGVLIYSHNLYINLKTNESFNAIRVPNT